MNYTITYRSGPDKTVRKATEQSFDSDDERRQFIQGMKMGGATDIAAYLNADLAIPVDQSEPRDTHDIPDCIPMTQGYWGRGEY